MSSDIVPAAMVYYKSLQEYAKDARKRARGRDAMVPATVQLEPAYPGFLDTIFMRLRVTAHVMYVWVNPPEPAKPQKPDQGGGPQQR